MLKWAVVTNLSQDELNRKYGLELAGYKPYILMTVEQWNAFHDYDLNEKKHDMRSIRNHDMFGYEEGLTEYCHSVFSCDEPEDTVIAKMEHEKFREAIDRLPEAQRRRCILYYENPIFVNHAVVYNYL